MYLTKNEIEIMDVLWEEKRPLSRGEILSLSVDKTWMDSSIHVLLNSMIAKGAIEEAGFVKCGKTCGRVYKASLSCEEYFASTIDSTKTKPSFPKLVEAYIEKEGIDGETISRIMGILNKAQATL